MFTVGWFPTVAKGFVPGREFDPHADVVKVFVPPQMDGVALNVIRSDSPGCSLSEPVFAKALMAPELET
jgi:hypothetical protein